MTCAVLVIDVQSVLFDPAPKPFEAEEVVIKINTVTDWARSKNYPVVFIQHEATDSSISFDSKGWQLQTELNVQSKDQLVRKTTPDSFLNTKLEALLKSKNIQHLIICGYATEFCVDTTSRRAAGLGYSIQLVADAHTTHDKEHATALEIRKHHNCTLPNISSFGIKISVIAANELISER